MIVPDTSIFSSFAKIGYLDLVRKIFPDEHVIICSATMKELLVSKEKGYEFVYRILKHIAYKDDEMNSNRWLRFRYPDERVSEEINHIYDEYPFLHFGEIEAIAFTKIHNSALLIDDRRAWEVAKELNIEAFTLPAIIQFAKATGIIGIDEIRKIILLLEIKDHYKFKHDIKQKLLE